MYVKSTSTHDRIRPLALQQQHCGTVVVVVVVAHTSFAIGHDIDDGTGELRIDIDDQLLDGLELASVLIELIQDFRWRDRQLKAFTSHGLDQNAELQLTTTMHFQAVTSFAGVDLNRHVALNLLLET
jgi:hypothetical protein